MTDDEIIVFAVLGALGLLVGGAWSVFAMRKWNSYDSAVFAAPFIAVGLAQSFLLVTSGVGAFILLPGLGLAMGIPAYLAAGAAFLILRRQAKSTPAEQDVNSSR